MHVWMIGAGYVGLVTGVCFAKLGHDVTCVDTNREKIELLRNGQVPIYEPGLTELLHELLAQARIRFMDNLPAKGDAEVAVIAVGTPPLPNGAADLRAVYAVVDGLSGVLPKGALVAVKSTVPVGTTERIRQRLREQGRDDLLVAMVPEFLREGQALNDVFSPARIVFGVTDNAAEVTLRQLHSGIEAPVIVTDPATAEMIKYASNAFLATKISFINEIANICDRVGADVTVVAHGMGLDPRIGPSFLRAGLGYGGSCFPKDTRALVNIAGEAGYDFQLLRAVVEVNQRQRTLPLHRLREWLGDLAGRTIALLGVAFKPGTDDVRESPALDLYEALRSEGAVARLVDPVVGSVVDSHGLVISVERDPYVTLEGADAAILVTEWSEYLRLDWSRVARAMKHAYIFDGRNALDPVQLQDFGITVSGVGRGAVPLSIPVG